MNLLAHCLPCLVLFDFLYLGQKIHAVKLRSVAQLKSSLLCVADSVSAFQCSNRPPAASLQPQVCMFAPLLVLA